MITYLMVEPTSNCNLKCVGCSRNALPHALKNVSIDSSLFNSILNTFSIKKLVFSGSYGEPTLYENFKYFINKNHKTTIITNGNTHNIDWWADLANIISGVVVFSVFGTQETAHLYQQGTNVNKVIDNMKAFISNGGHAIMKHIGLDAPEMKNDADKLQEICNKIGAIYKPAIFYARRVVNHIRKGHSMTFNGLGYKSDQYDACLKLLQDKITTNLDDYLLTTTIKCKWQNNGVFIDFDGTVWPCCYSVHHFKKFGFVDKYEKNFNNLYYHNFNDIINHAFFTEIYNLNNDATKTRFVCSEVCGQHNNYPNIDD